MRLFDVMPSCEIYLMTSMTYDAFSQRFQYCMDFLSPRTCLSLVLVGPEQALHIPALLLAFCLACQPERVITSARLHRRYQTC